MTYTDIWPSFLSFNIQSVHLSLLQSSTSEAAKSVCFISTQSKNLTFSQSILRNQTLLSSPLAMGSLKRKKRKSKTKQKKNLISTIQNQTVLFFVVVVPHIDLCVKASNSLARPTQTQFQTSQTSMCELQVL